MFSLLLPLKRLYLEHVRKQVASFAQNGLTPTRYQVLRLLKIHRGPVRQSEVARSLGVARSSLSRIAHALVDEGLIARTCNAPGDRRQIHLSLTPAGDQCITRAMKAREPQFYGKWFGVPVGESMTIH